MDKEKEAKHDIGYSEKQLDLAVDKFANNDQVKGNNIFVSHPKKDKKKQNSV